MRSTVARMRSGDGGRSRNQTLMIVERSCGSFSMCQIRASLLLIVSSYVILLMSVLPDGVAGAASTEVTYTYRRDWGRN